MLNFGGVWHKISQEDDEEIDPDVRELGDYFNIEERWATWQSFRDRTKWFKVLLLTIAPPQKKWFQLEVLLKNDSNDPLNGSILFRRTTYSYPLWWADAKVLLDFVRLVVLLMVQKSCTTWDV